MDREEFLFSVNFNGKPLEFKAEFSQRGFSWAIVVDVNGSNVLFEPDEERNLRARIENETDRKKLNPRLVKAIGEALEELLRR